MRFESMWALLLLLVIPLLVWLRRRGLRIGRSTLRFSTVRHAARSGRSLRQRFLFVPFALRITTLVLLALALARPQEGRERVRDVDKGIAIEMVIDRSGSMRAEMEYDRERLNRLEVVKRVFEQFVAGNGKDLPGRPSDLVGMVTFARYADTVCPLTLSHGAVSEFLDTVELVQNKNEDGTAIGDAVALAAARLQTAEQMLAAQTAEHADKYEIESKIIILLTDGQNNAGRRSPLQAARLAADWGIKIYTIGVGGDESIVSVPTFFGMRKMAMGAAIDEAALKAIAKETGGIYRRAEDAESLREIYGEIDKLERSAIESVRYMDYRERFVPLAVAALLLLFCEVALACTIFRRAP